MKKNILVLGMLMILVLINGPAYSNADVKKSKSFDDVLVFNEKGMFAKSGDKWGRINKEGDFVVKPIFDKVYSFKNGFSIVKKNNKYGVINKSGDWIINARYETMPIYYEKNGVFIIKKNKQFGLIDVNGNKISEPIFEYVIPGSQELLIFKKSGQYGLMGNDGEFVTQPIFEEGYGVDENLIAVKSVNKWGFINNEGNFVIKPMFDDVKNNVGFSEGLIPVKLGGNWGYINKKGEFIIKPMFKDAWSFDNDLAPVQLGAKWGYINKKSEIIIEPMYDSAGSFEDGFAVVSILYVEQDEVINSLITDKEGLLDLPEVYNEKLIKNGDHKYGVINRKGEIAIKPEYYHIAIMEDDVKVITFDRKVGVYDKKLKCWLQPSDDKWMVFNEKEKVIRYIVFANKPIRSKDDKIGYLNLEGEEIIKPKHRKNEILEYSEGLIGVKVNEKWGYLDRTGKVVIEPKFDEVGLFYGELASVKIDGKYYFINKKGEFAF